MVHYRPKSPISAYKTYLYLQAKIGHKANQTRAAKPTASPLLVVQDGGNRPSTTEIDRRRPILAVPPGSGWSAYRYVLGGMGLTAFLVDTTFEGFVHNEARFALPVRIGLSSSSRYGTIPGTERFLPLLSCIFFLPQSIADGRFRRYCPVAGGPPTGQLIDLSIPPDTGPYRYVRHLATRKVFSYTSKGSIGISEV
ncbi:hypothetical protein GW17_00009905 [Ensete ventricosum]|nr:hypothetical protein GW17_00009905 [Ensete ventricosum]